MLVCALLALSGCEEVEEPAAEEGLTIPSESVTPSASPSPTVAAEREREVGFEDQDSSEIETQQSGTDRKPTQYACAGAQ